MSLIDDSNQINGTVDDMQEEQSWPNISQWIANAIADAGVSTVFGGHGGAIVPMVNAVCDHPDLKWICTRTEGNAASMAAAYAKYTGELGVVIATSGPGATNLTTGLLEGVYDRCPMLAITGSKPRELIGFAEFQDCNQSRLFAGAGVEWSKDAASPEAVIPLLRDAVATALSRRTCVHLAIPVDIQASKSPLPLKRFCASHALQRAQPIQEDMKLIEAAAKDLVGDKPQKNVIVVGLRACYGSENGAAITALAEALNAPMLTRLEAKGVINEYHPLSFGVVGVHGKVGLQSAAALISSCDRVICIGVDEETLMVCNVAGLQIRRVIEIEPDAFGLTTRYNSEHSLVGPIEKICEDLALVVETMTTIRNRKQKVGEILKSFSKDYDNKEDQWRELEKYDKFSYMAHGNPNAVHPSDPSLPPSLRRFSSVPNVKQFQEKSEKLWQQFHNADWVRIAQSKSSIKYQTDLTVSRNGFAHPAAVLDAISHARTNSETAQIMKESVLCVDVGDITLWASLCMTLQNGSRTLYSERLGTMGYSLCAGIASVMCRPSPAASIVLAGDGGIQMTIQELATFQQNKRKGDRLIVFVFDNKVLGRVAFGFDNARGCEFQSPDYVALAKAYGGDGVILDNTSKAAEAVHKAFQAEGLFVVHAIVDPHVKADMANFTDNSMKSIMNSG